jgi:hypothetical protein
VTSLWFVPDPVAIVKARRENVATLHRSILQRGCFEMDVGMRVGGGDVLAWVWQGKRRNTMLLPLLDVAGRGLAVVRTLLSRGRVTYDFPDASPRLLFAVVGAEVQVRTNFNDGTWQAPYAELLRAWEQFADSVRDYLRRECPELADNPVWGAWLAGSDYEELP